MRRAKQFLPTSVTDVKKAAKLCIHPVLLPMIIKGIVQKFISVETSGGTKSLHLVPKVPSWMYQDFLLAGVLLHTVGALFLRHFPLNILRPPLNCSISTLWFLFRLEKYDFSISVIFFCFPLL